MTHAVTEACIGCKYTDCVDVCFDVCVDFCAVVCAVVCALDGLRKGPNFLTTGHP